MRGEDADTADRQANHDDERARQRQIDEHDRALADEHEEARPVVKRLRPQRDMLHPTIVAWMDAWDATELAT